MVLKLEWFDVLYGIFDFFIFKMLDIFGVQYGWGIVWCLEQVLDDVLVLNQGIFYFVLL